jgi:hypothetical protein
MLIRRHQPHAARDRLDEEGMMRRISPVAAVAEEALDVRSRRRSVDTTRRTQSMLRSATNKRLPRRARLTGAAPQCLAAPVHLRHVTGRSARMESPCEDCA